MGKRITKAVSLDTDVIRLVEEYAKTFYGSNFSFTVEFLIKIAFSYIASLNKDNGKR